jgi:hypothetical protein
MSAQAHRKQLHHPASDAAASLSFSDSMFNLLYGAMINQLGLSPSTFQLSYPFVSWNWPVEATGFTSSAQNDFCSQLPIWNAIANSSSASRIDQSYGTIFLPSIPLSTLNPTLQGQINTATQQVTLMLNAYNTAYQQGFTAWQQAVGSSNSPNFTAWLATSAGFAWSTQINAATTNLAQANAVLAALSNQTNTPAIAAALNAFANSTASPNPFYEQLADAKGFPAVPGYDVSNNPVSWVQQVQGGGGTGGSVQFSAGEQAFDYSNTWSQSQSVVDGFFFSVVENNTKQEITQFQSAQSLSIGISFAAWDQIGIVPGRWFNGSVIKAFANGPFNVTAPTPIFGENGYMNVMKTGLIVAYQPTITITTDASTFNSVQSSWTSTSGIDVGPFYFDNSSSGGNSSSYTASASNNQLVVKSTSTTPMIIGVLVDVLP